MLNKSNLKEKVTFMLGYTAVMALIMWALMGCAPPEDNNGGDDPGTGPPPPNSDCDYTEMEINNTPDASNFITNLPSLGNQKICGNLSNTDTDVFYFFFDLAPWEVAIKLSFWLQTDPSVVPKGRLLRTIYNSNGAPTGTYDVVGTFVGTPGSLLVLGNVLPYDMLTQNDVFMELSLTSSSPGGNFPYTVSFWNHGVHE
tara:strand:- start:434 stop:1030 length:597 start_codon:yes stop_codon:yes gene_type:complete